MFRLRATGARADLDFNLKQHLGGLITRASTGAAQVISVAPADVTMRHRGGVTTVRVRRGTVVALGIGQYDFGSPLRRSEIHRFCRRGRPTIRCLGRIRYRFFTTKRVQRAKILRAGQVARFKRPPSVVRIVGP